MRLLQCALWVAGILAVLPSRWLSGCAEGEAREAFFKDWEMVWGTRGCSLAACFQQRKDTSPQIQKREKSLGLEPYEAVL